MARQRCRTATSMGFVGICSKRPPGHWCTSCTTDGQTSAWQTSRRPLLLAESPVGSFVWRSHRNVKGGKLAGLQPPAMQRVESLNHAPGPVRSGGCRASALPPGLRRLHSNVVALSRNQEHQNEGIRASSLPEDIHRHDSGSYQPPDDSYPTIYVDLWGAECTWVQCLFAYWYLFSFSTIKC